MKTKKWWDTFVERMIRWYNPRTPMPVGANNESVSGGPALTERGPIDDNANDKALVEATEETPLYKAVMDHAYTLAGSYMVEAFNEQAPSQERLANLDRAAGLRSFIGNVEEARLELRRTRARKQERDAQIAAARERAKRK